MSATAAGHRQDELQEAYGRCMGPMLQKARHWFPTLHGLELDLYQHAWEAVLRARDRRPAVSLETVGQATQSPNGGAQGRASGTDLIRDRTGAPTDERVETREDARLAIEILAKLTPLQQKIIKLRWGLGIPRKEVARLLGMSERRVKRELEEAGPVIAEGAEAVRSGRWCQRQRSLVLGYAFDVLGSGRAATARRHLEACPGCRDTVRKVRGRLTHLGAVAPMLPPAGAPPVGALERAGELADAAREGLSHVASSVKHHALAVLTRTPVGDAASTQIAASGGLRGGGSMATALVACVAAGGGATYCAIEGVPDGLLGGSLRAKEEKKTEQVREVTAIPQQLPVSPLPETAPKDQASLEPGGSAGDGTEGQDETTRANALPASPAPTGSTEFNDTAPTPSPRKPAPAPSSSGGEFRP